MSDFVFLDSEDDYYYRDYDDDPFSLDFDFESTRRKPRESALDIINEVNYGGSGGGGGIPMSQLRTRKREDVPQVEDYVPEKSNKLDWWRSNKKYVKWLESSGYNTKTLKDWEGNQKFVDYVDYTAKRIADAPLGKIGHSLAESFSVIGKMLKGVGEAVDDIPVVNEFADATGGLFKLVGNLLGGVQNIMNAVVTGISSGHVEEIPDNLGKALVHMFTGGFKGRYFSSTDGLWQRMEEGMKASRGEHGFQEYMNTDEGRRHKRLIQVSGLAVDLIVDPMWLVGLAEVKALTQFRGATKALTRLRKAQIMEKTIGTKVATQMKQVVKAADIVEDGTKIGKILEGMGAIKEIPVGPRILDFMGRAKQLGKAIKADTEFAKVLNVGDDIIHTLVTADKAGLDETTRAVEQIMQVANDNMQELRKFGSHLTIYKPKIPFVGERKVLWRSPLSVEPIKEAFAKLGIGGVLKTDLRSAMHLSDVFPQLGKYHAADIVRELIDVEKWVPKVEKLLQKNYGYKVVGHEIDDIITYMMEKAVVKGDDVIYKGRQLIKDPVMGVGETAKRVKESDKYLNAFAEMGIKNEVKLFDEVLGITEVKDFLKTHKAKITNNILEMERTKTAYFFQTMASHGFADIKIIKGTKGAKVGETLQIIGIDKKGFKTTLDFKSWEGLSEQFIHPYLEYYKWMPTKKFKEYHGAQSLLFTRNAEKGIESFFKHPMRSLYLPTDISNQKLINIVWGTQWDYQKLLSHHGTKEAVWMNTLDEIRKIGKIRLDKSGRINNISPVANGIADNLDLSKLVNLADDGKVITNTLQQTKLVDLFDVNIINNLSNKGLIFPGFKDNIFETGVNALAERVQDAYRLSGKLEATIDSYRQGINNGWLKRQNYITKTAAGDITVQHIARTRYKRYMGKYEWVPGEGIFRDFYVPAPFQKQLNTASRGLLNIVEDLSSVPAGKFSTGLDHAAKWMRSAVSWTRVQMTLKHPGFHMRNFISNRIMMQGEGRSFFHGFLFGKGDDINRDAIAIHRYGVLRTEMHNPRLSTIQRAKLTDEFNILNKTKIKIGYMDLDIAEAYNTMSQLNVCGNGLIKHLDEALFAKTDDVSRLLKKPNELKEMLRKANIPFGKDDPLSLLGRKWASYIEEAKGRNELFFHLVNKKGMDIEDAARRVNRVMIDYGSLSKGEKAVRNYIIPFYTWQSRMIGVMFEKMLAQPTAFTQWIKLQNASYTMLEVSKTFAPEFEQVGEGFPMLSPGEAIKFFIGGKPLGEIEKSYFATEGFLPQTVINIVDIGGFDQLGLKSLNKLAVGVTDYFLGQGNPFFKIPIETISNYSFYFKRKISKYKGDMTRYMGFDVSPYQRNIISSFMGISKEINDVVGIFEKNAYTEKPYYSVLDIAMKWGAGLRVYDRDESKQVRKLLGQMKDALRGHVRDMRNKKKEKDRIYHAEMAARIQGGLLPLDRLLKIYKEMEEFYKDEEEEEEYF